MNVSEPQPELNEAAYEQDARGYMSDIADEDDYQSLYAREGRVGYVSRPAPNWLHRPAAPKEYRPGMNAQVWLDQFRAHAKVHRLKLDSLTHLAITCMDESSQEMIRREVEDTAPFEHMAEAFLRFNQTKEPAALALAKLNALRQGPDQTVALYMKEFRRLAGLSGYQLNERIAPSPSDLPQRAVAGLRYELAMHVCSRIEHMNSLNMVEKVAIELEHRVGGLQPPMQQQPAPEPEARSLTRALQESTVMAVKHNERHDGDQRKGNDRRQRRLHCYNCGKNDHILYDCTEPVDMARAKAARDKFLASLAEGRQKSGGAGHGSHGSSSSTATPMKADNYFLLCDQPTVTSFATVQDQATIPPIRLPLRAHPHSTPSASSELTPDMTSGPAVTHTPAGTSQSLPRDANDAVTPSTRIALPTSTPLPTPVERVAALPPAESHGQDDLPVRPPQSQPVAQAAAPPLAPPARPAHAADSPMTEQAAPRPVSAAAQPTIPVPQPAPRPQPHATMTELQQAIRADATAAQDRDPPSVPSVLARTAGADQRPATVLLPPSKPAWSLKKAMEEAKANATLMDMVKLNPYLAYELLDALPTLPRRADARALEVGESDAQPAAASLAPPTKTDRTLTLSVRQDPRPSPTSYASVFAHGFARDVPVQIFIDSGSGISVISKKLADLLRLDYSEPSTIVARSCLGNSASPLGVVRTAPVKLGPLDCKATLHVMEGAPMDILLGTDWLVPNRALIDLDRHSLTVVAKCGTPTTVKVHTSYSDVIQPTTGQLVAWQESHAFSTRLKLRDAVQLAPRAQVVVEVTLAERPPRDATGVYIVSAPPGVLNAPAYVLAMRTCSRAQDGAPTRVILANCSGRSLALDKHAAVAQVDLWRDAEIFDALEFAHTPTDVLRADWPTVLAQAHTAASTPTSDAAPPTTPAPIPVLDHLPAEQRQAICDLLREYPSLLSADGAPPKPTTLVEHTIDTGDAPPVRRAPYRLAHAENVFVKEQVERLLRDGLLQESSSPWAAPLVIVGKKSGGYRMCVDYRALNAVTVRDAYPLPVVEETLDCLRDAEVFTTLDLLSGYWQVPLATKDRQKTAFTCRQGLYEWTVMPFGLVNAPATFQRFLDTLLRSVRWDFALVYIDDIIVYSKSFDAHLAHLRRVFDRLSHAGLRLNLAKCLFAHPELLYLGHVVNKDGVAPDRAKVAAVLDYPRPKDVGDVRAFLGLAGYYRKFVPQFAELSAPLAKLLVGSPPSSQPVEWSPVLQTAIDDLKSVLTRAPCLAYPDFGRPYTLFTDASAVAIGAVLSQEHDGDLRVIAYASRALRDEETRYSATDLECLAVVWSCQHFRPYLVGTEVTVVTDHRPLTALLTSRNLSGRLYRWSLKLSDYKLKIVHRAGSENANADALSRHPPDASDVALALAVGDDDADEGGPLDITRDEAALALLRHPPQSTVNLSDHLQRVLAKYVLVEGVLYRRETDTHPYLRFVPPVEQRMALINDAHELAGHASFGKTYDLLMQRAYWPSAYSQTRSILAACRTCQLFGSGPRSRPPVHPTPVGSAYHRVGIDLVGPLPVSRNGNRYIIVCTDYLTRYAEAGPLPDKTAVSVATWFYKYVLCRHGCPQIVLSDNGLEFKNAVLDALTRLNGIIRRYAAPYHPATNGLTEAANKTLCARLKKLLFTSQCDWDELLPAAVFAYNVTSNETTGMAPFAALYGRPPILPFETIQTASCVKDVADHVRRIALSHAAARDAIQARVAPTQPQPRFATGTKILVKVASPAKLMPTWKGPATIVTALDKDAYKVAFQDGATRVVHSSDLKAAFM